MFDLGLEGEQGALEFGFTSHDPMIPGPSTQFNNAVTCTDPRKTLTRCFRGGDVENTQTPETTYPLLLSTILNSVKKYRVIGSVQVSAIIEAGWNQVQARFNRVRAGLSGQGSPPCRGSGTVGDTGVNRFGNGLGVWVRKELGSECEASFGVDFSGSAPVIRKCHKPGIWRAKGLMPYGAILCDDCNERWEQRDKDRRNWGSGLV